MDKASHITRYRFYSDMNILMWEYMGVELVSIVEIDGLGYFS